MRDNRGYRQQGSGRSFNSRGGPPQRGPKPQLQPNPTIIPLPADTQAIVNSKESKAKQDCQNVGLLLERYVEWEKGRKGLTLENTKKELLNRIAQMRSSDPLDSAIRALSARSEKLAQVFKSEGHEVKSFRQKPDWRLIVGLGGASVLETAMTLHPVYGFPIIPGSSLKGLARAYAETNNASPNEIDAIFGPEKKPGEKKQSAAGKVIFFDALPTGVPSFEMDIMNVHYGDYYTNKGANGHPPADYLSPNPIPFLTVGKNTEFLFVLASREKGEKGESWLAKAEKWLKGGLKEMGVGAKTMVGYGYFQ